MKDTNTLTCSVERMLIELHSPVKIAALLKQMPPNANYIAVNRYKCGSIFYQVIANSILVDHLNGAGWGVTNQKTIDELDSVLQKIGFFLVQIPLLEKELSLVNIESNLKIDKFYLLEQQVATRIETVSLRRDDERECQEYWRGQVDAFEITKHMIKSAMAS